MIVAVEYERKETIWSCYGNDNGRFVVEKWRGEIS